LKIHLSTLLAKILTITVYAANPSGNVTSAPLATYGGGSTALSSPLGIAIH